MAQARLEITPQVLNLGERPIGAWTEPATFTLENTGIGVLTVNSAEISPSDFFGVVGTFPQTLQVGDTYEVGISTLGTATPGVLTGDFAAQWGAGRSVTVAEFTATAYTPVQGDVYENPFMVAALPLNLVAVPTVDLKNNYNLTGAVADGFDGVYMLSLATDQLVSVNLTATDAKMAVYSADFALNDGPRAGNELYAAEASASNLEMFAGDYYLVVSTTGASYDLAVTSVAMPSPVAATYVAPADGAVDIINGDMLEWTFNANTLEYQVVLGTTYPPATVVVDWTSDLATEYTLANLEPNLQYFWQINTRNGNGTTVGAIWGFTTTLTPPQNFMANNEEIYEGDNVVLSWESPVDGRAFLGYNVYQDGVQLNASLLTATTYTVSGLTYNMGGYDFTVTSVFDEGESDPSAAVTVQVSGEGMVNGNVSDVITIADIAGATLAFSGDDEFGVARDYTFTTNASGNYSGDVLAGTYDIVVSAEGYISQTLTNVDVAYNTTVTNDFEMLEVAYPVAVVTASEFGDNILIEFSFDAPSFVPQVYPFDTKGMSEEEIQKEWNGFLADNSFTASAQTDNRALVEFQIWREQSYLPGSMEMIGTTTQTQFVDFDWNLQTWGVYKWYVVAVYDQNQSAPVASNPVDKDMYTTVDVAVTLNSADSPAGVKVEFTNVDESPELSYSTLLSDNGMFTWDSFRKGTYDIEVSLAGYATITETGVDIFDEASFSWQLVELLAAPVSLYVTPTGLATWEAGSSTPFAAVTQNFNDGFGNWTVEATNTVQTWGINSSTTSNLDGTPFAYVRWTSTAQDEKLVSPVINTAGTSTLYVQFEQYYNDYSGTTDEGTVQVFDGTDWVTVATFVGADYGTYSAPDFQNIDVTAYKNANFQVRFRYIGLDDLYWAVDNVVITDVPAAPRAFETYKLFFNGTLLGELSETEYQHGGFGETLVDGETYTTGVAGVFSTGQSATSEFTWKYVACENYDVPADFMAEQVVGALDINLSWTNVDATALDTISALRIYRNGEEYAELDFTAGAVSSFLDEDLEFGTYNYCVTYIYNSGAETCTGAVCSDDVVISGGGFVNGTVTAFVGGAAIEGATVTLSNADFSFEFTTNASGLYEGEVVAGTYDYLVEANTFESQTLEGVVIVYGATVTNDFALLEFPYGAGDVVATELTDNAVQIDWSGNGGGGGSTEDFFEGFEAGTLPTGWVTYDVDGDGNDWENTALNYDTFEAHDGAYCMTSASYINGVGALTPNNYLVTPALAITAGSELHFWVSAQDPAWSDEQYYVKVSTTGNAVADFTETVHSAVSPAAWGEVVVDLSSFAGETIYIAFQHADVTDMYFIKIDDVTVTNTATRAAYTEPVLAGNSTAVPFKTAGMSNETIEAKMAAIAANANRELTGYSVYRTTCETGELQFLGFTLDQQFTDNTWGSVEAGVYKWGVVAEYDLNNAEISFSNCLDKDMITMVSVTVTTNSADSPAETDVTFTNVSEPDLALEYSVELDETGYYAWDEFRKGVYNILVEKRGFETIEVMDVEIMDATDFTWVLNELLYPVGDLYVTPTGYATWRQGGIIPFAAYAENFDNGIPETWTIVDGGSTADTWYMETPATNPQSAGASLDGTPFAYVDSDEAGIGSSMDEMMISPVIDASNAEMLFIHFDQYYNMLASTEYANVDVFDGTDWVTVLHQTADAGAWNAPNHQVIDVTEYMNEAFQVRFHYYSPGWNWYWAVDNFAVTEAEEMDMRAFQNYKVWLDGIFVTDTQETAYQYDVTNLVPGQSYLAEVAAMYTNGMSEKMQYTWTYVPCSDYPGPEVYTAEVINDNDVLLTWSNVEPMQLVQVTQNPGAPANGYYQQFGYGYGVAYDLSAYPDALVNAIDFHHASWGTTGTWDYNIHIYDWDTKTLIATVGPIQTTGNDIWEMGVELGDISTGGASTVAILMEPLGNVSTDAYPDLSSDDAANPQGSIYGSLSDVNAIGSSTIGNFLMDMYIYTANGAVRATPVSFDLIQAPAAMARIENKNSIENIIIKQDVRSANEDDAFVGANIYRNGIMIAEMLTDTFYVDQNVNGGEYTYCLRYVYESGAMTCEDAYCEDVTIPCEAPKNLDGEYVWNYNNGTPEFGAMITWEPSVAPVAEWLFYDDGTNVDGIGGPETFTWAIKFDPAQLADFDGASLTKISLYNRVAGSNELRIYEGTNAATLLHTQTLSGLAIEAWEEVDLTSAVLIDVTKELWIAVYTTDGINYPAGCGPTQNQPNGDLITLDGAVWEHLSDYALPYTWNLRGFVTTAAGATVALPMDKPVDNYNADARVELAVSGKGAGANNVLVSNTRELDVFNIYRKAGNGDYSLLTSVPADTFEYFDTDVDGGTNYCYQVTALYNYGDATCESDPANALVNPDEDFVCIFVTDVNELGAKEARLYPNPATNNVTIEAADMSRLTVINAVGQVVYDAAVNDQRLILNTASYEAGVYMLRIVTNSGIVAKRVTIVR